MVCCGCQYFWLAVLRHFGRVLPRVGRAGGWHNGRNASSCRPARNPPALVAARARKGTRPRKRRNLSIYFPPILQQINLLPPFAAAVFRAVLPIHRYWPTTVWCAVPRLGNYVHQTLGTAVVLLRWALLPQLCGMSDITECTT